MYTLTILLFAGKTNRRRPKKPCLGPSWAVRDRRRHPRTCGKFNLLVSPSRHRYARSLPVGLGRMGLIRRVTLSGYSFLSPLRTFHHVRRFSMFFGLPRDRVTCCKYSRCCHNSPTASRPTAYASASASPFRDSAPCSGSRRLVVNRSSIPFICAFAATASAWRELRSWGIPNRHTRDQVRRRLSPSVPYGTLQARDRQRIQ